jgi:hypothetical protein
MDDDSDWRLTNQADYLTGVELRRQTYRRPPHNPDWDHDHCSFCWAKFAVEDRPEVLHEGYCTLDEYNWVCTGCFADFREMFGWREVTVPEA